MAIVQRKGKGKPTYQVKVRDARGIWISKTFRTKKEATIYEASLELKRAERGLANSTSKKLIFRDYIKKWDTKTNGINISKGWREAQMRMYWDYIDPIIGDIKLENVNTEDIMDILNKMNKLKKSPQTILHVYNMLHKMFNDAVELFDTQIINPVKKALKPSLPEKETAHLEKDEVVQLLRYVKNKPFGVAIWLGLFAGLRVGEIQALKWKNIDLDAKRISIRATYIRNEKRFQNYPKGKKWHDISIPPELVEVLVKEKKYKEDDDFVVTSTKCAEGFLSYSGYYGAVKRYCKELKINIVGPHGLRHSTESIYSLNGATISDLQGFFAHSSSKVTERYMHNQKTNMDDIIKKTKIIPIDTASECSQNVPKSKAA